MAKRLPKSFNCPVEFTLKVLGGKWKTVLLCYLKQRECRYSEFRRILPGLSDKMLTERLRDLIAAGLIDRRNSSRRSASHVYYLTPKGRSLGSLLHDLYNWGRVHAKEFGVAVDEPLKKLASSGSVARGRISRPDRKRT
jgi:DNA-binding HxlR family transcriptional regulator